ncbi:hypothetical protein Sango_0835700 [Sesamum angolense]|uniref:Retroviral polymerase SH3-like domain-containing protein n=1 Tax=Sesamum angolense TaxID=2727404 RepID=A0AAE1X3Z3_9LAMI|nr:hypothetical protein Sango_0835700 [Sesamum angolense]
MGIFLGHNIQSKGYRIYNLKTKKRLIISRDVEFNEDVMWNWDDEEVQTMEEDIKKIEKQRSNRSEVDLQDEAECKWINTEAQGSTHNKRIFSTTSKSYEEKVLRLKITLYDLKRLPRASTSELLLHGLRILEEPERAYSLHKELSVQAPCILPVWSHHHPTNDVAGCHHYKKRKKMSAKKPQADAPEKCMPNEVEQAKLVKPFLELKTYKKIKFVYSDQPQSTKVMESPFDMDKLEPAFRGKSKEGFDYEAYAKCMKMKRSKNSMPRTPMMHYRPTR